MAQHRVVAILMVDAETRADAEYATEQLIPDAGALVAIPGREFPGAVLRSWAVETELPEDYGTTQDSDA